MKAKISIIFAFSYAKLVYIIIKNEKNFYIHPYYYPL